MGITVIAGCEERFLVNRDFHLGNLLLHHGRWARIAPKPLLGKRAFDTAQFLRSLLPPRPEEQALRTLVDMLAAELVLPAERIRHWAAGTRLDDPARHRAIAAALDYRTVDYRTVDRMPRRDI